MIAPDEVIHSPGLSALDELDISANLSLMEDPTFVDEDDEDVVVE